MYTATQGAARECFDCSLFWGNLPVRALDRWESRLTRDASGGTPVAAPSYMGVCDAYTDRYADLACRQAHLANSPRRRWRHADSRVGEHSIATGEAAAACLVGPSRQLCHQVPQPLTPGATIIANVRHGGVQHEP